LKWYVTSQKYKESELLALGVQCYKGLEVKRLVCFYLRKDLSE
jgi:hypothetical protein